MAVYINPWDVIAKGVLGAGASGLAAYGFAEGDLSAVTWTELGVGIRSAVSVAFKTGGVDKLLADMLVDEHGPLVGGVKEQVDSVIKKLAGTAAGEPTDVVSAASNALGGLAERGQALLPDQPPSFPLMNQDMSIRLQKMLDDVAPHYPPINNPLEAVVYKNYPASGRIPYDKMLDAETVRWVNNLDDRMTGTAVISDGRGVSVTQTFQNGREIQCEIYRKELIPEIDNRTVPRRIWDNGIMSLFDQAQGIGTELITETFDAAGNVTSRVVHFQGPGPYRDVKVEIRDDFKRAPNGDAIEGRRFFKNEVLGGRAVTYEAVKDLTGLTSLKINGGEDKLGGRKLLFAEPTDEMRMQHLRERALEADRRVAEEAGRLARKATEDGAAAAAARTSTGNLRRLKEVDPEHFQDASRANLIIISMIEAILLTYLTGCGFGSADQGGALDYSKSSFSDADAALQLALADPLQWHGDSADAYNEEVRYQIDRANKAGIDGITENDRHKSYATILQDEICTEALHVRTLRWILEGLLTVIPLLEWIAYRIRNTLGVPSCVAFQLSCFTVIIPTATSYVARAGQDAGDRAAAIDKVAYDFARLAQEFSG